MTYKINGIQQLGVGVEDLHEAWTWYREYFGMDIRLFEEEATAELMLPHTDGQPRMRHAVLALNMQGGGGFEIWQHTGKKPEPCSFEIQPGDLGVNIGKIKSNNIEAAFPRFNEAGLTLSEEITEDPRGNKHFYLKDKYENLWEIVSNSSVFRRREKRVNGGIYGAVIGVRDMEKSLPVYQQLLHYDQVVYDKTGSFEDLKGLPGDGKRFRRVLLSHDQERMGAFSRFFGRSEIELIQVLDREPRNIYEGRIWGDPGFIHLCFDINEMDTLRETASEKGFPFTVDSAKAMDSFDMGQAAGSFAYIQAPEGTLIEFVETHKMPVIQKLGWYLDLRKRKQRPLPDWLMKMIRFSRVKD